MKLNWMSVWMLALGLTLSIGVVGCEVDEDDEDATTEGTTEDPTTEGTEAVCGDGVCDEGEDETSCADDCVVQTCDDAIGCGQDGICCDFCEDENNNVTDPDCNTTTPINSDSGTASTSANDCDCDFWGFICEAADQCSAVQCSCDVDCASPDSSGTTKVACSQDEFVHCDTFCPTGSDPDCAGTEDDGKFCD